MSAHLPQSNGSDGGDVIIPAEQSLQVAVSYNSHEQRGAVLDTQCKVSAPVRFSKDPWPLRLISLFSWFCNPESRRNLAAMRRDLRIDINEMRHQGYSKLFISTVVSTRSIFGGILPIVADGVWRLVRPSKIGKDMIA